MRKFPFTEGQDYYTIDENNNILWSCWDCISEELHTPDKVYFKTFDDAQYVANFNKKYNTIISLLINAQGKLSVADTIISNHKGKGVDEMTAESYVWDAIKSINRAVEYLTPKPSK